MAVFNSYVTITSLKGPTGNLEVLTFISRVTAASLLTSAENTSISCSCSVAVSVTVLRCAVSVSLILSLNGIWTDMM